MCINYGENMKFSNKLVERRELYIDLIKFQHKYKLLYYQIQVHERP
jgi:hypothetical protein